MDSIGSSPGNVPPANQPTPTPGQTSQPSLEQLFRSKNPAAVPILYEFEKKKIGFLKNCIRPSDPTSNELQLKILRVALNCIGIARENIDSIVEENFQGDSLQKDQLKTCKEAAQALNATFNFIEIFAPEERSDRLIKALINFFWVRSYKSARYPWDKEAPSSPVDVPMIELFKKNPPNQQLNVLGYGLAVCRELHLGQEPDEICAIFEVFWSILQEERQKILELAWPLLDYNHAGSKYALLLKEISQLNKEVREEIVKSALCIIQKDCGIENKSRILQILSKLPKEQREEMINATADLLSGYNVDVSGDRKAGFIETMMLLPQERRLSSKFVIRDYSCIVPTEARRLLHQKLSTLPHDQLVDVIRQGSTLCEFSRRDTWGRQNEKATDYVELFDLIISIPPDCRAKYAQMAKNNINNPNTNLRNRIDYLNTLMVMPDLKEADQVLINKFFEGYHEEIRAKVLQFLADCPEIERADILKRSLSVLDSMRSTELLDTTVTIAVIPPDQRQEVLDCLWYIRDSLYKTADCLKEIFLLPKGQRQKICKTVRDFNNKLRCIRILGQMSLEQRTIIARYAKSLPKKEGLRGYAPAEFINLMEAFPEAQRNEALNFAFSFCTRIPAQNLDVLICMIKCQLPEHRLNVCSWFNQAPLEQIQVENQWFRSMEFSSKEDAETKIRDRFADKNTMRYPCDIVVKLIDEEKEVKRRFGPLAKADQ